MIRKSTCFTPPSTERSYFSSFKGGQKGQILIKLGTVWEFRLKSKFCYTEHLIKGCQRPKINRLNLSLVSVEKDVDRLVPSTFDPPSGSSVFTRDFKQ